MLVGAESDPPVVRLVDAARFVAEQREKLERKETHSIVETLKAKEMRFSCNIADHDASIKIKKLNSLLAEGYGVKMSVFFTPPIPYDEKLVRSQSKASCAPLWQWVAD